MNRELTLEDYLAMLRRRAKVLLIPAFIAPLVGWLVSYGFSPKYTAQALVLVEGQKVPTSMVEPVVSEDLTERIAMMQEQILSQTQLQPMLERLNLVKSGQSVDEALENIRTNMTVEPVITDLSQAGGKKKPGQNSIPGFYVEYSAHNAREAQQVCNELTSLLLNQNLRARQDVAKGTTDLLSSGLEDGKRQLDDLDAKLAAFKRQHVGQLPGDEDNNLKILMGLNSQLEANTQTLNRAQQDKSYTESLLAQQVAAWKASQSASNPQTLERQLSELQSELLQLQARYTADHPDVIKTKADIAEVQKKLAEVNKAAAAPGEEGGGDKASGAEPPEIRQLRLQIHQYTDMIAAATRDQKRLQQEIAQYQNRVALSPAIEEQYKALARDYENAQKNYQDLLANKSKSDLTLKMEQQQQGEYMHLLDPATLPDQPSFPNRLLFAGGGLGAGLVLALGIALWLELQDKSIRTEADAEAALSLPLLVAVPWLGDGANTNGKLRFWKKGGQPQAPEEKRQVGA